MDFWQTLIPEERQIWGTFPFLVVVLCLSSIAIYLILTVKWEENKWRGKERRFIKRLKSVRFFFVISLLFVAFSIFDYSATQFFFHCSDSTIITFPQSFYEDKGNIQPEFWEETPEAQRYQNPIGIGKCDYITAGNRVWSFLGGISFVIAASTFIYTSLADEKREREEEVRENWEYQLDYAPDIRIAPPNIRDIKNNLDLFFYEIAKEEKPENYEIIYPINSINIENTLLFTAINKGRDNAKHLRVYISKKNISEENIDFRENIPELQGGVDSSGNFILKDIDALPQNDYYKFWKDEFYKTTGLDNLNKGDYFFLLVTFTDRKYKKTYFKCYQTKVCENYVATIKNSNKRAKFNVESIKQFNPTENKFDFKEKSKYLNVIKLSINKLQLAEQIIYKSIDSLEKEEHTIILPDNLPDKLKSQLGSKSYSEHIICL